MKAWVKGGIIGLVYSLLCWLITFIITYDTSKYLTQIKALTLFSYHFISDVYIQGSPFYQNLGYALYGILIYPISLIYQLADLTESYWLIIILPLIIFSIIGALIGLIIEKMKKKNSKGKRK